MYSKRKSSLWFFWTGIGEEVKKMTLTIALTPVVHSPPTSGQKWPKVITFSNGFSWVEGNEMARSYCVIRQFISYHIIVFLKILAERPIIPLTWPPSPSTPRLKAVLKYRTQEEPRYQFYEWHRIFNTAELPIQFYLWKLKWYKIEDDL